MKSESSLKAAGVKAVRALRRETRAADITIRAQAQMLGVRPGTVSSHYKRGDMPVTQFLAIADMAGADASRLIAKATEETKAPQSEPAGREPQGGTQDGPEDKQ